MSVSEQQSVSIPIHTRSYATEAFAEPDGTMRVHGRLTDTKPQGLCLADGTPLVIHDMALDVYVEPTTFAIWATLGGLGQAGAESRSRVPLDP